MADLHLPYPQYCGLFFKEIEEELKKEKIEIEQVLLKPPFEVEPVGELRVVLLRLKGGKRAQALLAYDNYLSSQRCPRSTGAFRKAFK